MALVTDSFCERCGTKYVFQAPAVRALSMKNARVLARSFRNFVMNDGQSFEDSLHAARHEDSSADSSRLTQAFHRAFNFCMSCRQYACEQCWNVKAGACLTCAPLASSTPNPEHDRLIARVPVTRLDAEDGRPSIVPPALPQPAQASYSGPAAFGGPASSGGTVQFSAGRLTSEPAVEPEQLRPVWPETDRPYPEPEAAGAEPQDSIFGELQAEPKPPTKAPEWVLRRGSVDGESVSEQIQDHWNLWPVADSLAPEATLTPEELSLVEAQLLRPDEDLDVELHVNSLAEARAPEPGMLAGPTDFTPAERRGGTVVEPAVEPPAAFPVVEAAAPVPAPAPGFAAAIVSPEVPTVVAQPAAGPSVQPTPNQSESPLPMAFMALRGTPSNGIWPHPTRWVERPNKSYSPIFSDEAVAEGAFVEEATAPVETGPTQVPVVEAEPAGPIVVAATEAVVAPAEPQPAPAVWEPAVAAQLPIFAAPVADALPQPEPGVAPSTPALATPPAAPAPAPKVTPPEPAPELRPVPASPAALPDVPVGVAWQQRLIAAAAAARSAEKPIPAEPVTPQSVPPTPLPMRPITPQPIAAPVTPQPIAVQPAPRPEPVAPPQPPAPVAQPLPSYQRAPYQPAPAAQVPAYQEQPPQGWPPLGAQWPAPVQNGPVWPAPTGVAAPAAMLTPKAEATTEMWAQSAQEVMNRGTVRVCHHCALPLSTHARFCRRCGTSQN